MLFGSTMLEIAISLFFIYLLFSLICSAVNEWLAGLLSLRAKTLREGIENLLDDQGSKALAVEFYKHPLIAGLSRRRGKQGLPSYIPSSTFVHALLDITRSQENTGNHRTLIDLYKEIRDKLANPEAAGNSFEKALLTIVDETGLDQGRIEKAAATLQRLAAARLALTDFASEAAENVNNELTKATLDKIEELDGMLRKSEEEVAVTLASIQEGIESYFNHAMGRVSGWYKRRAQGIIIAIALTTSALLNVDSVAIATNLVGNSALRASIVAAAEQSVQNSDETLEQSLHEALTAKDELAELGLPIGWQAADFPDRTSTGVTNSWPAFLLSKVLGILVTTVAVSLGAPFWFDLLNKLVNLRLAGQKE